MAAFRAATARAGGVPRALLDAGLLVETGAAGVYGQGPDFERVRDAFTTRSRGSRPATTCRADAVPAAPAAVPARDERLPRLLPPPRRDRLLVRRVATPQALEQEARAGRHEDWSEFQSMTDLVAAARLPAIPSTPRSRSAAPCRAGGVTVDTGSRLGLPQRAVGRSRADADLPHARARPDRRSGRRRRVPRPSGSSGPWASSGGSGSTRRRRWPPTRSSVGSVGCSPRTSATRS